MYPSFDLVDTLIPVSEVLLVPQPPDREVVYTTVLKVLNLLVGKTVSSLPSLESPGR